MSRDLTDGCGSIKIPHNDGPGAIKRNEVAIRMKNYCVDRVVGSPLHGVSVFFVQHPNR